MKNCNKQFMFIYLFISRNIQQAEMPKCYAKMKFGFRNKNFKWKSLYMSACNKKVQKKH